MAKATLVIMAAGMGSRYGGDKQVEGVGPNGEFLMQYGVYDAVRAGFDKVVFIIKPEIRGLIGKLCGEMAEKLKTPEGKPVEVLYADQTFDSVPSFYHIPAGRTKPFGTCHAVLCVRDLVQEPFCVINADDYYGADAYPTIFAELMRLQDNEATMVGYLLCNTVTEHGTVTRGVCRTAAGKLAAIHETHNIQLLPNGSIVEKNGEKPVELDGDSIVSMNFWGFTPAIFNKIDTYFCNFLRTVGDDLKAECLLPTMVGDLLETGELSVSVLHSEDSWFGMTYQEDRALVQEELKKLHQNGIYPEKLVK